MKVCTRCHIEKRESEMASNGSWCRECNREYCSWYYKNVIKPTLPVKEKREVSEGCRFCVKCHTEKPQQEFYKKSSNICKLCANAIAMVRYYEKHDEVREKAKIYRGNNKEVIKERAKEQRIKSNHTKYSGDKAKEYRKKITNSYIRCRLRGLGIKNEDITAEMIEIKKNEIVIERIKKQIEKAGFKVCNICKKNLKISEYYTKQYVWNGVKKYQVDNVCKKCNGERSKKYYRNKHQNK